MDRITQWQRSTLMSKVRGKNTRPEKAVRSLLHRLGFRFRLHVKELPGSPDIVLPKYKAVIFVHGCFWHQHPGCKKASVPETRKDFWNGKLQRNVERDEQNKNDLQNLGWSVLVVWECELKSVNNLSIRLKKELIIDV